MQFDSGHSKNVVSLEDYRQNRRPIFQLPDNYFDQFNRYLIPENYRVDSSGLYRCDDATDNDSKRYLVANFILDDIGMNFIVHIDLHQFIREYTGIIAAYRRRWPHAL